MQDFVAARMTVLVVHFLETVQIQNDQAELLIIAACAIKLLVDRFIEEAAILQAGERVGDRGAMEILELFVFENNREPETAAAGKNVHERGLESDGRIGALRKLRATRENLFPQGDALILWHVQMRQALEKALEK